MFSGQYQQFSKSFSLTLHNKDSSDHKILLHKSMTFLVIGWKLTSVHVISRYNTSFTDISQFQSKVANSRFTQVVLWHCINIAFTFIDIFKKYFLIRPNPIVSPRMDAMCGFCVFPNIRQKKKKTFPQKFFSTTTDEVTPSYRAKITWRRTFLLPRIKTFRNKTMKLHALVTLQVQ